MVRGLMKIDVRDKLGDPAEAKVTVRRESTKDPVPVARQGDVYVAPGLVEGKWLVEIENGPTQPVTISDGRVSAAVFWPGPNHMKAVEQPARVCHDEKGSVVEAVIFRKGKLAAGRLDVVRKGKFFCGAIIAGGAASLRLPVGDYMLYATLVGGARAQSRYRVLPGKKQLPLVMRTN